MGHQSVCICVRLTVLHLFLKVLYLSGVESLACLETEKSLRAPGFDVWTAADLSPLLAVYFLECVFGRVNDVR